MGWSSHSLAPLTCLPWRAELWAPSTGTTAGASVSSLQPLGSGLQGPWELLLLWGLRWVHSALRRGDAEGPDAQGIQVRGSPAGVQAGAGSAPEGEVPLGACDSRLLGLRGSDIWGCRGGGAHPAGEDSLVPWEASRLSRPPWEAAVAVMGRSVPPVALFLLFQCGVLCPGR